MIIVKCYFILCIMLICGQSYAQDYTIRMGILGQTQLTQSIMFAENMTPYYNVWDFNSGIGFYLGLDKGKNTISIGYRRARLINSYDIVRLDPLLTHKDKKQTKNLNSVCWTTNEYQVEYERCVLQKGKFNFSLLGGFIIYNGQLNNPYFPDYSQTPNTHDIVLQNGKKGTITYYVYEQSVRDWGFGLLFGTSMNYKWNKSLSSKAELAWNSGLTPLVSTDVEYNITSPELKFNIIGEHSSLSSNSGLRLSLGIDYTIMTKSPKK